MRLRSSLAIALTIAGSTSAVPVALGAPESFDERRYVEEVLRGGLEAQVVEAETALRRADAVGVGLRPNPMVEWQRESARSGPRAGETQDIFAASVPLVLSGRLGLEREAARQGTEVAAARGSRARAGLHHEAVRRFYAAIAAAERRTVAAASLSRLQAMGGVIATREKAGDVSGYDRLRMNLEAAAVEDLALGIALAEHQAKVAALVLLGPQHRSLPMLAGTVSTELPAQEKNKLLQDLENQRADIRAERIEASAAETARKAANRGWIPDLTVHGGAEVLQATSLRSSTGYVLGLGFPLPIFQRRQGESARAGARRELAVARRAAIEREARTRLDAGIAEVERRRSRREGHAKNVLARAEELREVAATAYRGGAAEVLVVVDAERALRDARLTAVDLALAVIQAQNDVLFLAGEYDAPAPGSP